MGLYTQLPDDIEEVDVIVTGGSKTALAYQSKREKQLGDRELIVPAGGVLGGGSSINMMVYSRGQRIDFDAWKTPGWFADDIVPYLKKFETYHAPSINGLHGSDGPIHVSRGGYNAPRAMNEFILVTEKMGWPETEDLQNLESVNAVQRAFRYVSPDGKRQDTAHGYLHPLLQDGKHPNLHVLVESQVLRVTFDGTRASGVTYRPNAAFQPTGANGPSRTVKARRRVVVACGALGTPPLLERSGVGDPEVLKKAGVSVVASVPGVGYQYEDHHLLLYSYKMDFSVEDTLDALAQGRLNIEELMKNNDKLLGWTGQDLTGKIRPTDADVAALGPEFQAAWDRDFKNSPTKPLMLLSIINGCPADPSTTPPGQYIGISTFSPYPYSRGHIHITSPELSDPLDFETGFFSDVHDIDLKKHIWAYKKQREIVRRMESYRGELSSCHPPFPANSEAACIDTDGPLSGDVRDIRYTAEDDEILAKWLRENVSSTWHSLGTCKMKPKEEMGVVDSSLNVYGVENLKIVDLSIVPSNVAANTGSTALAIGEKAADILIKELV
ncbi:hypothetical protein SLS62_004690 [Diatrype stigma]|uniref:Glucose-methanol-choline oxidoreductase N-terminal domain-containing protein n=1 Tax=Diatrype stigma TaxID=117547 RepID=A0AAN9UQG0_9PEZI